MGRYRMLGFLHNHCPGLSSSPETSSTSRTLSARADPTPIPTLCCKASSMSATRVRSLGLLLHQHIGMFAPCLSLHICVRPSMSLSLFSLGIDLKRQQLWRSPSLPRVHKEKSRSAVVKTGGGPRRRTRGGPRHHTVDDMIWAARRLHHAGHRDLQLWCHDHEAAFQQLLVEAPEMALLILFTEYGPTLWQNHVLLFGATGSVWGYGRFADFLMHVGRLSLLAVIFHYVDDFHGIESSATAESAFVSFEDRSRPNVPRLRHARIFWVSSWMSQRPSQSSNPHPSVGPSWKLSRSGTWTRVSFLLPRLDRLQARLGSSTRSRWAV